MIGEKTILKMKSLAAEQIDSFSREIDKAFLKNEDGKLKISMSFDLSMSQIKPTGIDVDCTLGFTADRVKNKISDTVVENQLDLPLAGKIYPLNDARMGE